uniref:Macaca fascicularis brain cDNA clone: QflA-17494, similar to human MYC binding protein 2 (MYCBP2), mRNA, RefSeq: NM_015057.1 n=1 Tax=Macaca fascicularis TaxID=9541 RepID=I7G5E7_MACFA|nr:unnamed protein product [Macaca fascicularis]
MDRRLLPQMMGLFSSSRVRRNQITVQMLMLVRYLSYYTDFQPVMAVLRKANSKPVNLYTF